jgi:hypothetical protein
MNKVKHLNTRRYSIRPYKFGFYIDKIDYIQHSIDLGLDSSPFYILAGPHINF